jgi:hypothetical protein
MPPIGSFGVPLIEGEPSIVSHPVQPVLPLPTASLLPFLLRPSVDHLGEQRSLSCPRGYPGAGQSSRPSRSGRWSGLQSLSSAVRLTGASAAMRCTAVALPRGLPRRWGGPQPPPRGARRVSRRPAPSPPPCGGPLGHHAAGRADVDQGDTATASSAPCCDHD